ncbi:MAG: flavin reductase family protein [Anaeroplasmataceae bacterium]|nr:flavin reductase family protein [Anaeroplasmataceae bacterium]
MSFRALDYSVSVIALKKDENLYGMTCAWTMQVDFDKMVCLLGSQSHTGAIIKKGDFVGISVLSKNQKELAIHFGENHSTEKNKFEEIKYHIKNGAIMLPSSTRTLCCRVLDVLHLKGIEEDSLIYVEILDKKENGDDFLHYSEL